MAKRGNNKRGLTWVIVLGIAFVLIVVLGLLKSNTFYSQQSSSKYLTYQDKTYGFSIEYLPTWKIKKDTQVFEKGDVIAFRISGPSQKKYTELSDGAQLAISKPFTIDADLTTWMKSYFTDQTKFSKLPLNNYAFEVAEDCKYMECMRYYFTEIDSQIYGIALYAEGASAEKASYENTLIYMLKSLKFTNEPTESALKEKAIAKVKELPEVINYLKRVPQAKVYVNGEDENAYMIQVYEIKDGHTATFNWYKVDKKTGTAEKEF